MLILASERNVRNMESHERFFAWMNEKDVSEPWMHLICIINEWNSLPNDIVCMNSLIKVIKISKALKVKSSVE